MAESKGKTAFICSRDTLEGVYPPLILGINSARLGYDTTVFFTFMGMNVVRKGWLDRLKFIPPGMLGAIPGMSNLATWMMKRQIRQAGIPDLNDLMDMALMEGVKLVACHMTVTMMKLSDKDFIEGVSIQNAEDFMKHAMDCQLVLFI